MSINLQRIKESHIVMAMKFSLIRAICYFGMLITALLGLVSIANAQTGEIRGLQSHAAQGQLETHIYANHETQDASRNILTHDIEQRVHDRGLMDEKVLQNSNSENNLEFSFGLIPEFIKTRNDFERLYREFDDISSSIFTNPFEAVQTNKNTFNESKNFYAVKSVFEKINTELNKVANNSSKSEAAEDCYDALEPLRTPKFWQSRDAVVEKLGKTINGDVLMKVIYNMLHNAAKLRSICLRNHPFDNKF